MKTLELFPSGLLCRGLICIALSVLLGAAGVSQSTFTDERTRSSGSIIPENTGKADKNTVLTRITPGDALINGLTLGRGSGSRLTNSVFGYQALFSNTTGGHNTASGYQALNASTTGFYNTAIGSFALLRNTTASANTAIGAYVLRDNTTGYFNTAMGGDALLNNTIGKENTAIGIATILNNNEGNYNTAVGSRALNRNVSGHSNVAIGVHALYSSNNKSNLVAVGDSALYHTGQGATDPIEGAYNTAIGSKAMYSNTKGYSCTAIGVEALKSNTEGQWNTAVGLNSLQSNTTGFSNTAIGLGALQSTITSNGNTAIGGNAGRFYSSISYGTFLGYSAYPGANSLTNITAIGYNARPTKSDQIVYGNSSVKENLYYGSWGSPSDSRYKKNISEDVAGLDFILKLRPVTYNMDVHKLAALLEEDMEADQEGQKTMRTPDEAILMARDQKSAIRYSGFIAQEVEAIAKEVGYDFAGVSVPENENGYYALDYISLTVPIVKAIQEQQAQIEALSPEGLETLKEEMEVMKSANEHLLAAEAALRSEYVALTAKHATTESEVSILRAENETIRGKIKDILALLSDYGTELGTLNANSQDCCNQGQEGLGHVPGQVRLQQGASDNAKLEQNAPNPFHENTLIRYYLPQETQRANIIITDLGGTQVMSIPLEGQGVGQALINGGSLVPGTYIYTLVVDGRQVDSKRMVIL